MKVILLSWIFLVSCTNTQPTPTTASADENIQILKENTANIKETDSTEIVTPEKKNTAEVNANSDTAKKVVLKEKQATPKAPAKPKKAQPKVIEKEPTDPKAAISHKTWDGLLQKYVSNSGKVNYKGFKSEEATLDAYLDFLSKNVPTKATGRNTAMAYWINAYNAFTIKLILKNYPVKSIMDINGGKAWDLKFIQLGGKTYTLNDIEHTILRPTFKDGRIHFAVNCAAKSCPPIHNHAWTAGNLEATLDKKAKAFINNANYNKISAKKVKLSNIFNWYKEDFGDLISFLNKYADTKIEADAKVSFIDYNWALNQ